MFANSPSETKTNTEKAFVSGFAKQIGDIGKIMMWIVAMAMFTILLVAGNTMAQAIRERTNELAVLKTLGFGDGRILALVLLESLPHRASSAAGSGLRCRMRSSRWSAIRPHGIAARRSTSRRRRLVVGVVLVVALGLATGSCRRCRPAGCASSTR